MPGRSEHNQRESPLRWRAVASLLVSLLLTASLLFWLWHRHGLEAGVLRASWREVDKTVLTLVFLLSAALQILLGTHKLHLVLRALGVEIRFLETLQIRLGSAPLFTLLHFGAGELSQLLYLRAAKQMPLARASGAVAFDKGVNFFGALFWLVLGLLLALSERAGAVQLRGTAALLAVLAFLLCSAAIFLTPAHRIAVRVASRIHPRFGSSLAPLLEPFSEFGFSRKLLLSCYGALFQIRPVLVCYLLLAAHGLYPGVRATLLASASALCAGFLPGFVAGSGPREAALVELLRPQGLPPDKLFAVGLLLTLAVNIVPAILGTPWTLGFLRRLRVKNATAK